MFELKEPSITTEQGTSGLFFGKDAAMPWALAMAFSEEVVRERLAKVRSLIAAGKTPRKDAIEDHLFQMLKCKKRKLLIFIPAPKWMDGHHLEDICARTEDIIRLMKSTN